MTPNAETELLELFQSGRIGEVAGLLDREPGLLDSLHGAPLELAGLGLAEAGRAPEAEAAFRRVIAEDPATATAHLNLGVLLLNTRRQ